MNWKTRLRIPLFVLAGSVAAATPAAQKIRANKTYPAFSFGPTGAVLTIEPGFAVTVQRGGGSGLRPGDHILAAAGAPLRGPDPRIALGRAIAQAEAAGGKLELRVRRGSSERDVVLEVPALGEYSKSYPRDCPKSAAIVRRAAAFVSGAQKDNGTYHLGGRPQRDGVQGCLLGLFLLSTGDARYLPHVRKHARGLAAKAAKRPTSSAWAIGYQGILLAEYYLKTGDKVVLPGLEALCRRAVELQAAGAWGHGRGFSPGYVQSGLMNSAGVPVLTAMLLAHECGVQVDSAATVRALKFFYRMAGHGAVCYGDHRSELFANTNGRNGMLACAMAVVDDPRCQRAAEHLALIVTDSYYAPEFGHTGGGFNVIWRGLGSVHVPESRRPAYARQMRELAWYYDLCRQSSGAFAMLPTPPDNKRYAGIVWGTGAIGLTYTAPLRTLRITGAKRTEHSVKYRLPAWRWGTAADLAFLQTSDCAGYGKPTTKPDEAHAWFDAPKGRRIDRQRATTAVCAQQLRHHSPMHRTWAARVLAKRASPADVAALVAAANHTDPRTRRAAFDGISGYDNWSRPSAPNRYDTRITRAQVVRQFLPRIVATLRDPKAAWWELDGALWALGRAGADDIRRHANLIRKFTRHEEWYLREAAFWALVGLGDQIRAAEFEQLADIYAAERHVFARSSFDPAFRLLLRGARVKLDAAAERRIAQTLGRTLHSAPLIESYGRSAAHEAAHRTMMIMKHFPDRVYAHMVPDFVRYLATWSPNYQHSAWLITGSKWQPGLIKICRGLGAKSKPILDAFRQCLERENDGQRKKAHQGIFAAMRGAIAELGGK